MKIIIENVFRDCNTKGFYLTPLISISWNEKNFCLWVGWLVFLIEFRLKEGE